ncbi:MAG: hypothetical protein ACK5BR_01665 [Bacteroidota bacterium]|jgi:hypothetical protein|nr:hypothetical protein [Algoriphagus sp.]
MKKFSTTLGVILLVLAFLSSCEDACKGHEADIENGQIAKAESMGMQVNSITVTYLGNCEYKCVSDVYDPGTAFSTPQNINSTVIFKWDGESYSHVRSE